MRILTLSEVGFTWRKPALLDNINLAIDKGERIGLLGRNGTGKSTLMKILAGEVQPDHGQIRREPQTRIARLIQEVHTDQLLNDKGQPLGRDHGEKPVSASRGQVRGAWAQGEADDAGEAKHGGAQSGGAFRINDQMEEFF